MTHTTEDAHMSRLARDMFLVTGEGGAINGFEAFALLSWLDLGPSHNTIAIVSILTQKAGVSYDDGKAMISGKAVNVEIDNIKMNVPARKTRYKGRGL